jgi:hypothetical protein
MANFDLDAACRIRLRQELETLLADAEPGCGDAMIALGARYPLEALEAMPRLRAILAPLLRSLPKSLPASGACGGVAGPDELDIAVLPEVQQITLWPYRPKREPDELFSSWLWRIARGHGAPPEHFARDMIGSRLTDIDRAISDTAIRRLAFLSGQPHGHLLCGTMRPDGVADPADLRGRVQQRLLQHGDLVLNRSRRGRCVPIIQYCPLCLRDALAYLRRGWRFSLEVACFRHGCRLHDACWRCGVLLDPLAQVVPSNEFLCIQCSAPLAEASCLIARDSVRDQAMLYQALDGLVAESEHEVTWGAQAHGYVGWREHHYVLALSSGDLRGTNPAPAIVRLGAVIAAAEALMHGPPALLAPPRAATRRPEGRPEGRPGLAAVGGVGQAASGAGGRRRSRR